MGDVDPFLYQSAAEVAVDLELEGKCRRGMSVSELLPRAHIGPSHFGQRSDGWEHLTDLAVRTTVTNAGKRVLYEEILSRPVPVRPRHNGLGRDRLPKAGNSLHLLVGAVAGSDRHCPTWARPLLSGTRDDWTSPRADPQRIDDWSGQLGARLPGTVAEHIEEILASQRYVRERFRDAARGRPELFGPGRSIDHLRSAFPRWLLIADLPYGPPPARQYGSGDFLHAGRDAEVIFAVRQHGRSGILYCGPPGEQEVGALRTEFEPVPPGPLPCTYEFGITSQPNVRYLWSRSRSQLAREVVAHGTRTDLWTLVGVEDAAVPYAMSIIERSVQSSLPPDCIERWARDTGPGLLKAQNAVVCGACVDLMNVANAGIVHAVRQR